MVIKSVTTVTGDGSLLRRSADARTSLSSSRPLANPLPATLAVLIVDSEESSGSGEICS